jgi:DNA transposition AAA+ family ATPase
MTESTKKQIQAALRKWLEDAQLSQNQAAAQLEVSAAYLSHMLSGKWEWKQGDKAFRIADDAWQKVKSRLMPADASWQIFETRNFKAVHKLCDDARDNKRFLAIAAPTGLGKTCALDNYRVSHPNTWYVLCDRLMNRKSFIAEIARRMGLESEGTTREIMARITAKMNSSAGGLLLLDDVGKLNIDHISLIQILYDRTDGVAGTRSCGIVICGTPALQEMVRYHAARNKHCMPEFLRRIGFWLNLRKPGSAEIKAIAQANGISTDSKISILTSSVADFGSLREMVENLNRVPDDAFTDTQTASMAMSTAHINHTATERV